MLTVSKFEKIQSGVTYTLRSLRYEVLEKELKKTGRGKNASEEQKHNVKNPQKLDMEKAQ